MLFIVILRSVAIYALFRNPRAKKSAYYHYMVNIAYYYIAFYYYMVYIACYTVLNLQICNYAKKQRICCKIVNTRLPKICMAIFALAERLPTSATLFKF